MSEKIRRLATIIKIIANNPGITLSGLQTQLPSFGIEVTERTLAKDILILKHEYHLLPEKERLRKGYVLEDMITLSGTEMCLVLDALHMLSGRMDDPEAHDVLDRLSELSSQREKVTQRTRTFRQRNILKSKEKGQTNRLLQEAIRSHAAVSFVYHTPRVGKDESMINFPILMVFHERGWYCIMKELRENNYFPRRVDRIKDLKINLENRNEHSSENFKEANYLLNCGWGMTIPRNMADITKAENDPPIVARFDRTIAPYILEAVERHPKGKVVAVKDGTGDVEFRINLSNAREFIDWIRSFGAKAKIIAPPSVVEKERAEIRRMHDMYHSQTGSNV